MRIATRIVQPPMTAGFQSMTADDFRRDPLTNVTPLAVIRLRAKQSRDDAFYDKLYTLALFFAGEHGLLETDNFDYLLPNGYMQYRRDPDLGLYPAIDPGLGPTGIQNHGIINSRINIQAVVYSDPEFEFDTDDPTIKEINQRWVRARWIQGGWGNKFYETGLDVEALGFGFIEGGINDHAFDIEPFSPLDCLYDRTKRSPADWRYYFRRRRLDVDQAWEEFGKALTAHYGDEESALDALKQISVRVGSSYRSSYSSAYEDQDQYDMVMVWRYWDEHSHCVFLGGINTGMPCHHVLRMNEQFEYVVDDEGAGLNPFGMIPVRQWVDSFSPMVMNPVGKAETTIRSAAMLNKCENYIMQVFKRGIPLTTLNTMALDPEQIESILSAQDMEDVLAIIPVIGEDAKNAIGEKKATEIPSTVLQARQIFKDELNAATGVLDSMRGVVAPGERTAAEVRINESQGGIQSRHLAHQYATFVEEVVAMARQIGALYHTKPELLMLQDGPIDTRYFPVRPFLAMPLRVTVQEDSVRFRTKGERDQERMIFFTTVEVPGIQMGVLDPYKVMRKLLMDLGVRDPSAVMVDQAMYQMQQALMMQQAASGGGDNQDPNKEKSNAKSDSKQSRS